MSKRKAILGSLGAIIILVISQILAQLISSVFILIKVPEGFCNIISGVLYLVFAYLLLKLFSDKMLKTDIKIMGMPKFSIKLRWILVGIILPVVVKGIYIVLFSGEFVSSGMSSKQMFSTLSAGIVFTGIAAGFVEEMVFRGIILNLLERRWNTKVAILIPSILFGALHIIGMNFSILSCLLVLVAGTMVGIMFSLISIEGGSVWNSGIVHAIWNIIIIGGGLCISEKVDEYSVLTYVLNTKSFAFTGGEFGIESSVIALIGYCVVALMAGFLIKGKNRNNSLSN